MSDITRELDDIILSNRTLSLSLEDQSEKTKSLLDRILAIIERIIESLKALDIATRARLFSIKNRIENTATATRTSKIEYRNGHNVINTRTRYFTINYSPISDLRVLITHLNTLRDITRTFFNFKDSLTVIKISDTDNLRNELNLRNPFNVIKKAANFNEINHQVQSVPILGSLRFQFENIGNIEHYDIIPDFSPMMVESTLDSRQFPEEIHFDKFPSGMQLNLLKTLDGIYDDLKTHYLGYKQSRRIVKIREIGNQLKALKNQPDSEDLSKQIHHYTTLLKWIRTLDQDLLSYNHKVITACLNLADINMQ